MTPSNPVVSTWQRDFSVLASVVAQHQQGAQGEISNQAIAESLDLSPDSIASAARNLERAHYVKVTWFIGGGFFFDEITERALRETGAWPNAEAVGDALMWALEQKVNQASSAEERGRWVKIRDAVGAAGRDIAV